MDKVDELAVNMEKMRLAEYMELLENPRRLLWLNFLIGLARGFGTAIGFTMLAALVLYFLQQMIVLNIPVIGSFIADIVAIVQAQLKVGGFIYY
ncbi:DUF5665 domain-containing protein [Thermosyntropha lipolytica]|nr:DUF5665 domain-containing protein [Thermosyntropha lipolytica]